MTGTLYLNGKNITSLDPQVFHEMYGVTSIWLNNNRIHALPPGVFGSDRKGIKDEKKSLKHLVLWLFSCVRVLRDRLSASVRCACAQQRASTMYCTKYICELDFMVWYVCLRAP